MIINKGIRMNAISKALDELKFRIHPEILNIGFIEYNTDITNLVSLDEVIMNKVIRPRVLVDCNLVGGMEVRVDLGRCGITYYPNAEQVITVPKSIIGNRNIITPLHITIASNLSLNTSQDGAMSVATAGLMNAVTPVVPPVSARLEMLGDNKIVVRQTPAVGMTGVGLVNGVLTCIVENAANMGNINPRSYLAFADLVTLAVNSYLYNHLKIKLNQGYIYRGHEVTTVEDYISKHESTDEEYREYLSIKWRKIAFMNDNTRMTDFVTGMV